MIKGKNIREVAKSLDFSQSTMNRMRRKHYSSLELPQRCPWEILTTFENWLVVWFVIVGGLETTVEVAKVLRVDREVGFYDNTLRNALRDVGLEACEKILKPYLSQKNIQVRLRFATIYKDWIVEDWKKVIFNDKMKNNCFNADGRSWCWINGKESLLNRAMK